MKLFTRSRPSFFLALLLVLAGGPRAFPDGPLALSEGELPEDRRLEPLKELGSGYFPFEPPDTRQKWEERSKALKRRILVATGLWPMPPQTPLNAVIHGRVERKGFTVEKVYFESYPGHHVTGLLFRPRGVTGRRPAVLCPHGHGGRLQDHGAEKIRELIDEGQERFAGSGRNPKLARCAQLARMGCVVFIYDMLGYVDSVEISGRVAHRLKEQRPGFDTNENWGLFSTQAELRLQSVMGIQTYNSIRSLDFLCSLLDVDPGRIGVTGGSGGGTQAILLGAIDPRPVVAFPQGMVSTAMQGGCACENSCLLRVGTGNVELAALFAPKPLGMTAANDWTKEMMTKGYPELRQLYTLLGAKDRVMCKSLVQFPHNYNHVTRAVMYSWFNQHLGLGLKEPIVEEDFPPLTEEECTVWNKDHPKPAGGDEYERSLMKRLDETSRRQIEALTPTDAASLSKYRGVVGEAFRTIIGRGLLEERSVERAKVHTRDRGDYLEFVDRLTVRDYGEELPGVRFFPRKAEWNRGVVVWVDGRGKDGLFDDEGGPRPEISKLLDAGFAVIGADLLYQGEFLADGKPVTQTREVSDSRGIAAYTFCYNDTLFAQRVHDVLTLVSFVRDHQAEQIDVVGVNGAGPWVAAASALAGDGVDGTAVDTGGFRFVNLKSYRDVNFLPGTVKYGDLPGMLSLCAPRKLWFAGENGKVPAIVSAAYRAAGKATDVHSFGGEAEGIPNAIAEWLATRG